LLINSSEILIALLEEKEKEEKKTIPVPLMKRSTK
jgi:hypothetical protein